MIENIVRKGENAGDQIFWPLGQKPAHGIVSWRVEKATIWFQCRP